MNKKLMLFLTMTLTILCVAQGAMAACPTVPSSSVEPGRSPVPTCQFFSSGGQPSSGNYGYIAPTSPASSKAPKAQSSTARQSAAACPAGIMNCPYGTNDCPFSSFGNSAQAAGCQTTPRYAQSGNCGTGFYYTAPSGNCGTYSFSSAGFSSIFFSR